MPLTFLRAPTYVHLGFPQGLVSYRNKKAASLFGVRVSAMEKGGDDPLKCLQEMVKKDGGYMFADSDYH